MIVTLCCSFSPFVWESHSLWRQICKPSVWTHMTQRTYLMCVVVVNLLLRPGENRPRGNLRGQLPLPYLRSPSQMRPAIPLPPQLPGPAGPSEANRLLPNLPRGGRPAPLGRRRPRPCPYLRPHPHRGLHLYLYLSLRPILLNLLQRPLLWPILVIMPKSLRSPVKRLHVCPCLICAKGRRLLDIGE
jgi:hypothetical protein